MARALTLGNGTGQSGALNISAGGTLNSGSSNLAYDPDARGTATVTGAGSTWTSTALNLGMDARAVGELNILNGGKVSTGSMYLGFGNGGPGASGTVLVSGNGSSFSTGGFVRAGYGGTGTITVTGAGASFSSGAFGIGFQSSGPSGTGVTGNGTFNLQNGATATSGSVTIGSGAGTSGTADISGNGTTWSTGSMSVGNGTLTVSSGAKVTSTSTNGVAFISGSANVTGSGSQWDIVGNSVGGSQNVMNIGGLTGLTVSDGGKVTIRDSATTPNGRFMRVNISSAAGSTNSLTVTGANSSFTTPFDVWVANGDGSSTGNITVSNGGALNTGYTILGYNGTGTALVTGAGSVWTISDMPNVPSSQPQGLAIGSSSTSKGTLTIADSGTVNVNATGGSVVIGGASGSQGTLNIGGAAADPAAAPGTLNATNVIFATGATGTINFNHTSSNYVFAPGIQGAGPGTVNFLAGTTILTGNNTYTGATNIAAGATAQFGNRGTNGGSNGLISGNVTNNGAMIVNLSSLFTSYSGVISGSGTFEQAGIGTLALTGNNTYSGLTTISSGTLKIGNGGTTGSVAGNIQNNSELAFDRSDNFTFSNLISGTGRLTKGGTGTMTLASAQAYTGTTAVSQGTLKLGGDNLLVSTASLFIAGGTFDLANHNQTVGAFSSGTGTVALGSGSLTFGNSLNREFQGTVTGTGSLIKQGTGTQTMSGNSSTYTGTTTINNGTMLVTGNLSNSATTANSGGILGGTGTVGATTINGTIAPGLAGAIGTFNVNGNYTQAANSFYDVHVDATGASDLVNVTGAGHTASINGGTVRVTAATGTYDPSTTYTILTSTGARTGSFAGVTSNFAFLDPSLSYDANNVYLRLVRNSIDFASVGITPNQISAGGGLAALGVSNPMVNAALTLSPDQARAAFDSVSGEIHPSLRSLMLNDSFIVRDAILGRQRLDTAQGWSGTFATGFAEEDDSALAYAKKRREASGGPKWPVKAPPPAMAPIYGAWVQGYGNWTQINSDGNAATLRSTNGGAIGGIDVTLNHNWRFGIATGGGHTDARVDARRSTGTMDTFHIAAYGGGSVNDIAFRTGASYSHHDIDTTRSIAFPGFSDTATASYGASTSQVFGEAAYRIVNGRVSAETFANLAYVSVRSDGFTERGGPAALRVTQGTTSETYSTLGIRAQAPLPTVSSWAMTARGSLGWQHVYDGTSPVSLMAFATSPAPFAIDGVPIAADTLLVEAGLDALVQSNAVLALLYTGRIASGASAHALKANLTVRF